MFVILIIFQISLLNLMIINDYYFLQAPQKIPAWIGELSATKFGFPCLQYTQLPVNPRDKIEGAEDCLYLNVYVPADRTPSQSLPVIFWIHGGAFQFGSGIPMGAKYLMDSDVIFVTINYRLGILGIYLGITLSFCIIIIDNCKKSYNR